MNVTRFFEYYTFDVMGDVNFGIDLDMLITEKPDPAVQIFKQGMKLFGPATPVPWAFRVAASVPGLQRGWHDYRGWADRKLKASLSSKDSNGKRSVRSDRQSFSTLRQVAYQFGRAYYT